MALWGKQDQADNKPKYITSETELAEVLGVNVEEAQQQENRAKGIKTPGWTKLTTYTDAQNNVRNKAETLVAMGSGQTVAVMSDAADDAIVVDRTITLTTLPAAQTVEEPAPVTFTVAAAVSPTAALVYQWQSNGGSGTTYTNLADAGVYTGTTTDTLEISDSTGLDGYKFRAVVSSSGATTRTSAGVTLAVTPAV